MLEYDKESNRRDIEKRKLRQNFDGKIVRKDLTKKIKEGANVPVYVLEFLLGQYCSSDEPYGHRYDHCQLGYQERLL